MHRALRCRLLGHRKNCNCQQVDERPIEPVRLEASPLAHEMSREYRRKKWRRR